jgi:hypothetical protein
MTIERDLLEKILNTGWLNHELSCEVEAILAKPELSDEQKRLAAIAIKQRAAHGIGGGE